LKKFAYSKNVCTFAPYKHNNDMTNQEFNAKDLKVGSVIEMDYFCPHQEEIIKIRETIHRVSGTYVWFKGSGYLRLGRETIRKYPTLYKIVEI
jgi:hypothetical protein